MCEGLKMLSAQYGLQAWLSVLIQTFGEGMPGESPSRAASYEVFRRGE